MSNLNPIYNDAQRYDSIHWWKKNDLDFWLKIFSEIEGNAVLELACGTGRIAYVLIRDGADFTGIDLSTNFVQHATKKLNGIAPASKIIAADMRNFNLNKKFDLIFIGFNSFLHLLSDEDALLCFNSVKKHMHKNSRFLIDIFIPNPLFLYRPEDILFNVLEYKCSKSGETIFVSESNQYNSITEINKLTWYFSTKTKNNFKKECFSMRMYFPSKMNQLLIDSGFEILHQWGDYYGSPLGEGSKLQIYDVVLS